MKNWISIFACLALASLACLSSVAPPSSPTAATAMQSAAVTARPLGVGQIVTPTIAIEGAGAICAEVIAINALHLRSGPSADDDVLTWLRAGAIVEVIDQVDADWWRIGYQGMSGYARSSYLDDKECGR